MATNEWVSKNKQGRGIRREIICLAHNDNHTKEHSKLNASSEHCSVYDSIEHLSQSISFLFLVFLLFVRTTTQHTCEDVLKMQKVNLPAENSCAYQPIAAEARRDITNATIENEIARAPANLSGPSKNRLLLSCLFSVTSSRLHPRVPEILPNQAILPLLQFRDP